MNTVYIVEDEANIRELITYTLNNSSYIAKGFPNSEDLFKELKHSTPDLFILDIMLEGKNGYEILKQIKESPDTKSVPVIMLTAKNTEFDKVKGLDMGADDFITKPFGIMELLSRIKAVLRRFPSKTDESSLEFEDLLVNLERRQVIVDNDIIELTYKEFELLRYLLENKEIVLTRDKLMNAIWGFDFQGESRTVDVHIRTLRQKLGDKGALIQTVRNVGYKIGVK